jgi:hypothetical protein
MLIEQAACLIDAPAYNQGAQVMPSCTARHLELLGDLGRRHHATRRKQRD